MIAVCGNGATGNLTTTASDVGGQPHFNATSRYTYNPTGQPVTATDPLGTVTQFSYDSFGNQTWVVRDYGPGHLNQLTSFGYSRQGDVVSITDPRGNVTTNTYDAARRLTTTTAPNGLITTYNYDPDGRVVQAQILQLALGERHGQLFELDEIGRATTEADVVLVLDRRVGEHRLGRSRERPRLQPHLAGGKLGGTPF